MHLGCPEQFVYAFVVLQATGRALVSGDTSVERVFACDAMSVMLWSSLRRCRCVHCPAQPGTAAFPGTWNQPAGLRWQRFDVGWLTPML